MFRFKNDILRDEYKLIAKFMGYTYFERNKKLSTQHHTYPGWFDTTDIDLTRISKSLSLLTYKSDRFITGKTLGLDFKHDYNKLMNIVEFIEKMESQRFGGFEVIINGDSCSILPKRKTKESTINTTHISPGNKKDSIYVACLKFIEKYNNLKEKDETSQFVS